LCNRLNATSLVFMTVRITEIAENDNIKPSDTVAVDGIAGTWSVDSIDPDGMHLRRSYQVGLQTCSAAMIIHDPRRVHAARKDCHAD
jgi:hypothetical protein